MDNTPEKNLDRLKNGFLFWNKYRADLEDQKQIIDFSKLQIQGDHWRYNELKGAELHHCDFSNAVIEDIDFVDTDFTGTDFRGAKFRNVHFSKCNFSEMACEGASFEDSKCYHVTFNNIDFLSLKKLDEVSFFRCHFIGGNIIEKGFSKEVFEYCIFE